MRHKEGLVTIYELVESGGQRWSLLLISRGSNTGETPGTPPMRADTGIASAPSGKPDTPMVHEKLYKALLGRIENCYIKTVCLPICKTLHSVLTFSTSPQLFF